MKLSINYEERDILGRLKKRQIGKKKTNNKTREKRQENRRISVKKIRGRCSINDKRNLTKNKVIEREEGRGGVI